MMTKLLPNERLDDLQIRGYEIIQSPGRFCFGMEDVYKRQVLAMGITSMGGPERIVRMMTQDVGDREVE